MTSYSAKEKAIAIAPKFTSFFSMFGSGFIIQEVLRDRRGKLSSTFHRLLLGMSICDLLASSVFFLTTWPIPRESGVYAAVGNQASCNLQGFFSQFSLTTVMYNASLSVYYLVKIRSGMPTNRIHKRVEPILHFLSLTIGIGTSSAAMLLDLYNNDSWECWIAPLPMDCDESWKNGGETNCIRGDNASLYRWVFYYALLWAAILLVTVCMFLVYRAVLLQERRAARWGHRDTQLAKKVANQGYWYCGAFYITWLFPTVTRLTQLIAGKTPYPLILITSIFVPIQGFCNFCVYVHPRYKKYGMTFGALRTTVSRTLTSAHFLIPRRSTGPTEDGISGTIHFPQMRPSDAEEPGENASVTRSAGDSLTEEQKTEVGPEQSDATMMTRDSD